MTREDTAKAVISLRLPETLRARIEAAAKVTATSMNNEINRRVERSLDDEERAGGPHTAALLRMISATIGLTETITGKSWVEDAGTRSACVAAIVRSLETYADPAPGETPDELASYVQLMRLRETAADTIGQVSVDALNERLRMAVSLMQQVDEAIAAGKPAGKLKLAAAHHGAPVQEFARDRERKENPIEAEMRIALQTAGPDPVRQADADERVPPSEKVKHD